MDLPSKSRSAGTLSRRAFLKTSAAAGASMAASAMLSRIAYAAGSDVLKVGLVGCGGRGANNLVAHLKASAGVEAVALGDLFPDRVQTFFAALKANKEIADKFKVTPETCFHGWDNAKQVIAQADVVLLCEPPGFRPMNLRLAIEAGKHVFAEKPVAVDPVGVRHVIETAKMADGKKLAIVAGTQTRHQASTIECIKRMQGGDIGDIVAGQCYFLTGELWHRGAKPEWSEMEYQCRNWYYFSWLSGDHIVEQHVHQHDLMNWAMGATPVKVIGQGGRQGRTDPKWGNIYDHFGVEYEYPGGVRVISLCRQANNTAQRVDTIVVGTKGVAYPARGLINNHKGEKIWSYEAEVPDPTVQEHADLVASIRAGKPLNDGVRIAETSLTSILGRMSAYTGREVNFSWAMNASKLNLFPEKLEFGPHPVDPVAMPGKTPLVGEGEVDPNPPKPKAEKKAEKKAAKK
ncbi:MAG: Gfo/Idh/MocA family oxidoreductase [Planctomycetota bacterium]|nr:Gfo/Idh/MocA family oxidoreductase [Planctomycetota bacterium]